MAEEMPLSLRQLLYFVTIAESGSITRAAELLLVSQPALSHQLRSLETSVGAVLLDRRPRGVALTPAGRALLPGARAALEATRDARRAARAAVGFESGELRIATNLSLALGVLPHVLRGWFARHPGIEVKVSEHTHVDLVDAALGSGEADVVFGPFPHTWYGPVFDLGEEEMVVVVGDSDPLARAAGERIRIRDLRDRRWVLPPISNGFWEYVERICSAEGFSPRPAVRSPGVGTLVALAASGLGPTLVPVNAVPEHLNGTVLALTPPLRRRIAVYTTASNEELGRAFFACADPRFLTPPHLEHVLRAEVVA